MLSRLWDCKYCTSHRVYTLIFGVAYMRNHSKIEPEVLSNVLERLRGDNSESADRLANKNVNDRQ